jgi:hypothetical protein
MVILFASFIGFLLFIEISLLTSPVDEIMAIVLAFLTYAIGFFSLMIHFLEEQTVSARYCGYSIWTIYHIRGKPF